MPDNKNKYWYDEPLDVCPICKKQFASTPDWYWKITKSIKTYTGVDAPDSDSSYENVCSYTCMRVWEKKQETERQKNEKAKEVKRLPIEKQKNHNMNSDRNLEIKKMADEGRSIADIAFEFYLSNQRVRQILKTFKED